MADVADLMALGEKLVTNFAAVDWAALEAELATLVKQAVVPVLDGAAEDVKKFAELIGKNMVLAIMTGNVRWQEQLRGQLSILAEISRVRSSAASWDLAEQVVALIFHAAVSGLKAAL